MFFIVRANVKHDKRMMTKVKKKPQQLEVYGSAFSIGFAPNTSKYRTQKSSFWTKDCLKDSYLEPLAFS
jgi:hypothetical protein